MLRVMHGLERAQYLWWEMPWCHGHSRVSRSILEEHKIPPGRISPTERS
jgi:hypothetical protein